eukprot:gene10517-2645_t
MAEQNTLTARLRRRLTLDDDDDRSKSVVHIRVKHQDEVSKHLTLNDKLGEGTFATVYTGVTNLHPSETRAVKVIDRRTSHWKLIEVECGVLERIQHEHIIALFMVIEAPKYLYLVLEWCRYGDLETKVEQMPENRLPDRTAAHITLQLADALAYLHHNDIAHRDVKCNNILIRNCPPCIGKEHNMLDIPDTEEQKSFATAWDVCLTDFGLSAENKRAPAMMSVCGTVITMAPEVLAEVGLYSPLCDVWSLGIVMFRLLTGRYPYTPTRSVEEMLQEIKTCPLDFENEDIDSRAKDLLVSMLKDDPAWRITAKEVLRHPWLTEQAGDMTKSILVMMREFAREEQLQQAQSRTNSPAVMDLWGRASLGSTELEPLEHAPLAFDNVQIESDRLSPKLMDPLYQVEQHSHHTSQDIEQIGNEQLAEQGNIKTVDQITKVHQTQQHRHRPHRKPIHARQVHIPRALPIQFTNQTTTHGASNLHSPQSNSALYKETPLLPSQSQFHEPLYSCTEEAPVNQDTSSSTYGVEQVNLQSTNQHDKSSLSRESVQPSLQSTPEECDQLPVKQRLGTREQYSEGNDTEQRQPARNAWQSRRIVNRRARVGMNSNVDEETASTLSRRPSLPRDSEEGVSKSSFYAVNMSGYSPQIFSHELSELGNTIAENEEVHQQYQQHDQQDAFLSPTDHTSTISSTELPARSTNTKRRNRLPYRLTPLHKQQTSNSSSRLSQAMAPTSTSRRKASTSPLYEKIHGNQTSKLKHSNFRLRQDRTTFDAKRSVDSKRISLNPVSNVNTGVEDNLSYTFASPSTLSAQEPVLLRKRSKSSGELNQVLQHLNVPDIEQSDAPQDDKLLTSTDIPHQSNTINLCANFRRRTLKSRSTPRLPVMNR